MNNNTFFISTDIHQWLTEQVEEEMHFDVKRGVNIRYDIIEQPFQCSICTDVEAVQLKVYIRSELGALDENPDLGITLFANGDDPQIINSGRLGGDVAQTALLFLQGGFVLYELFENDSARENLVNLVPETEGILVELNEDTLNFKKVSGKQRPDLACTTLFGGVQMTRPYEDEVMQSWLMDLIPFEEQLKAAEQGDEDAMLQVATTYLNGDYASDIEENPEQAVYWFQKLAEIDNPLGQFNLAIQYVKGEGVEQSFEKALYWMQKAEENGEEDALGHIEIYSTMLDALEKAKDGDPAATAMVAEQYMSIGANIGYEYQDSFFAKSYEWATKATELGDLNGLYLLGLCYEHGRGVESADSKAVEMYQKAAEQGHDKSQWNLAAMYIQGTGVERDVEKAQYWAEKSATQGYNLAIRGLFSMIIDFGEDDLREKFARLERLAEQCPNDAEVYHKLALTYMDEDENGNMYDMDRAIYWFKLAGENGHYMSEKQYHLWSYVKKLQAEGVVPEDGDYFGYIINNGLLAEAEEYEPC